MRKIWLLLLLAPSAFVYACSGDSSTNDGGTDATAGDASNDQAQGNDTGTQDTGTDTGTKDAGGDVAVSITCLAPSQCDGGGNPVCCGTLSVSGTVGNCSVSGASTACAAANSCNTDITAELTCSGAAKVRLCTAKADCKEAQYNQCCTFKQGDAGLSFCLNQQLAGDAGTCQ